MLTHLPKPTPDPIFAIAAEARKAGAEGINATIGMVMDEEGNTLVLPSVAKAANIVSHELKGRSFGYGHLLGLPEFREGVHTLILGDHAVPLASIATTGGTGAVAVNLRLLKKMHDDITVILPSPAWANHLPLLKATPVQSLEVPYFADGLPTIEGIAEGLKKVKGPVAVLLQVGCHNPTGLDFTIDQWKELAPILATHQCAALLDLAYQGFSSTVEEDAEPLHIVRGSGITTLVSWSASKNHSLYSERTGLAAAFVPDEETKMTVEGHYSSITRGIHSAAATLGQSIVAAVQKQFKKEWLQDIADVRVILTAKRKALIEALPKKFEISLKGHGMFAMLPISEENIIRLKNEEKVFMLHDGRINIAGIPLLRMQELGERIRKVEG
ncbi:MAG: aminotransferase class I/II-fold pyridoxal phosphate-dependent enzyme [Candidatus Peregrinibacteria bacterium]